MNLYDPSAPSRATRGGRDSCRRTRSWLIGLCLCALLWSVGVPARSAPPQAAPGGGSGVPKLLLRSRRASAPEMHWQVLACRQYRFTVMNLERSLAFYRDALGLRLLHIRRSAIADRSEQRLADTPGAWSRSAQLQLPGTDVQLVLAEFTRIERRRLHPRPTDPGAATLVMVVPDLDAVLKSARAHGATVLTSALSASEGRSVVLADPDGFYVRLIQPTDASGSTASQSAYLVYTVASPGPVQRFYHDLLGLQVSAGGFGSQPTEGTPATASRVQVVALRAATAQQLVLQFNAFRGLPRHTYLSRPQDPGTAAATLGVTNLPAAVRSLRAAGAAILTAGGQPVSTADGASAILLRDSAGILLELVQEPGR